MDEVQLAIQTLLAGDSTLATLAPGGVHHETAPADTVYPVVLYHLQSHADLHTFSLEAWEEMVWTIKCVNKNPTPGSPLSAQLGADRIHVLIIAAPLTLTGGYGTSMLFRRKNRLVVPGEHDDDYTYFQRGGLYDVWATKT